MLSNGKVGEKHPEVLVLPYPVNPEARERAPCPHEAPGRPLGPHDGRPNRLDDRRIGGYDLVAVSEDHQ